MILQLDFGAVGRIREECRRRLVWALVLTAVVSQARARTAVLLHSLPMRARYGDRIPLEEPVISPAAMSESRALVTVAAR